jgi:prepilin-type N-terminal cleavage/methylation domain-containing protein
MKKSAGFSDLFNRKFIRWRRGSGMTLIELLCVMGIIAILAAIYIGVIARAFIHVKKTLGH